MDPNLLLAQTDFIRRIARALVRDEQLADDVVQETLLSGCDRRFVAGNSPSLRGGSAPDRLYIRRSFA